MTAESRGSTPALQTSCSLPFTTYPDSTLPARLARDRVLGISGSVMTLNESVSASSAPPPEVPSTPRLDYKVLDGASDLLGRTDIFFVEVPSAGSRKHYRRVVEDGRGRISRCGHYRSTEVPQMRGAVAMRARLSLETEACSTRRVTFLHKRDQRTPRILLEFSPYRIRRTCRRYGNTDSSSSSSFTEFNCKPMAVIAVKLSGILFLSY